MDKIILADNSEIEINSMPSLSSITVELDALTEMQGIKDKLTESNLSSVTIKNAAGNTTGSYEGLILNDTWTVKWADNKILATFGLREMTDIEKLRKDFSEYAAVTDGAIVDLGEAVSAAAGGV